MKNICVAIAILFFAGCASTQTETQPNTLSRAEQRQGWTLLFDGTSTTGWRGDGKQSFPEKGWRVEDGTLHKIARERGGDIITEKMYSEFDFRWDWKLAPRGNNGVKYFVTPERKGVGHEYQMIDGDKGVHSTASFYEVLPPWTNMQTALKPPGEWNSSRILAKGNKVEHWLNGQKVLEYELGSDEVKAGIAKSKFKNVPHFGERVRGHILLTDHGDECTFRNLKILDLSKD
ncbi:MAG TPA: DUF1080 domain-containing protein [Verrucomicrobiae bacterium]|nr:DUF1080 domain-containing protein [Verrucomicrobiae bacterium]